MCGIRLECMQSNDGFHPRPLVTRKDIDGLHPFDEPMLMRQSLFDMADFQGTHRRKEIEAKQEWRHMIAASFAGKPAEACRRLRRGRFNARS